MVCPFLLTLLFLGRCSSWPRTLYYFFTSYLLDKMYHITPLLYFPFVVSYIPQMLYKSPYPVYFCYLSNYLSGEKGTVMPRLQRRSLSIQRVRNTGHSWFAASNPGILAPNSIVHWNPHYKWVGIWSHVPPGQEVVLWDFRSFISHVSHWEGHALSNKHNIQLYLRREDLQVIEQLGQGRTVLCHLI